MSDPEAIRADFERLVKQPEGALDLARAALLVAAESDPRMDLDAELHTLESWAAELGRRIDPGWNNLQKLARLRAFLFDDLGFRGDRSDYYDPRNSLLHEVMARRLGIPLTLSILFMELGWRIGMPFEGVGFPGHFLVRLPGEAADLLLDPFRRGMIVRQEDCRRMLVDLSGGRLEFEERHIASIGKHDMLARLLLNLKGAYLRANQDEQALAAVERLLLIHPEDLDELRDRGLLLYRLARYRPALEALETYLRGRPEAADRDRIATHAGELRALIAQLN